MCRPPSSFDCSSRLLFLGLFLVVAPLSVCPAAEKLSQQPSALLKAQAESPVDWTPWGDAAFARAQREQKPVFLAIGAFTSELTRAMSRQSFANTDTGTLLNDNFVCLYVDAKERPDVAAQYQNYLQIVKQLSGPPMNLWLTPELKPFEGANYLPPTEEWGKEGFMTANKRISHAWKTDPAVQRRKADDAVAAVAAARKQPAAATPGTEEIARLLDQSAVLWRNRYDPKHGGFGETPKQIEPELLRFLLADAATRDTAIATLQAIVNGALRDPLDGGFFRYAADAEWRLPYFQKLLIDQPRIALALLDAARITGEPRYAETARGALEYALDRLALAGGDFAAAEDATVEELTTTYFWTFDEIREVLGETAGAGFSRIHGVTADGNISEDAFPGADAKRQNILYRASPLPPAGPEKTMMEAAAKLRQRRQQRAATQRDDGSPSGAHGLMLAALSRAGAELKDARLAAAAKARFEFIRDRLRAKDGGLLRLAGRDVPATPADYAFAIEGLLTYSTTAPDAKSKTLALELLHTVNARSWDSETGRYFAVPAEAPGFWARVYSPVPGAGDPPAAEPAMLAALAGSAGLPVDEHLEKLVRTVAADIAASSDAPRGDLLFALRAARARKR